MVVGVGGVLKGVFQYECILRVCVLLLIERDNRQ